MNCQSCGMPMDRVEDHGGGDANNQFCKYCTDETGKLLPKDQVRAKMVQFYVQKQGKTQEEAGKLADQLMSNMPAWKGGEEEAAAPVGPVVEPEPAVGSEPAAGTEPAPATEPVSTPKPPVSSSAPGPTATSKSTPEPSVPGETPSTQPTGGESTEPSAE